MKTRTIFLIVLLAVVVSACIPSLNPLYKNSDLKTNDLLKGNWREPCDDHYEWQVSCPAGSKKTTTVNIFNTEVYKKFDEAGRTYKLVSVPSWGESREFAVHLLELDGRDYVNIYPTDWETPHEFLSFHMVETNIFARIEIARDTLVLHFFDTDYLEGLIRESRIKLSHVTLDGRILITAGTDELQKFVRKYGDDPQAFMEPITLVRTN